MAFELPRIPMIGLTDEQLQIYWQKVVEAIEAQEDSQNQIIADLAAAVADIQSLQTQMTTTISDLAAAVADIVQAQSDATDSARETARITSYPNPGNVVTATDAGANVSIVIANHTRVYPVQGTIDVPDVSITGTTLTGKAYSTRYYIYYDDATLADTTPSFVATTSSATAQVGAAAGRHFVQHVDTPAALGADTTGDGGAPPGGGGGGGGSGYVEP